MSETKPQQWFQVRLRWAVLEQGWGLSEDRETAFQEALRIGYAGQYALIAAPDQKQTPAIACRFAKVVYLEELGIGLTAFEVDLGEKEGTESIAFNHEFHPAAHMPGPIF